MTKLHKDEVGYRRHDRNSLKACVTCAMYRARGLNGICTAVEGTIKPLDICNLWSFYKDKANGSE